LGAGSRDGLAVLQIEAVARRENMNPDSADGEQVVLLQLVEIRTGEMARVNDCARARSDDFEAVSADDGRHLFVDAEPDVVRVLRDRREEPPQSSPLLEVPVDSTPARAFVNTCFREGGASLSPPYRSRVSSRR
jgi:hypothetical protein